MPEENWAAHGGIPACDLCHSRKVKCDRKDPCGACVAAKAECQRNRQVRAPRARIRTDDKIRALVEKLSSLEHAVTQRAPQLPPSPQGSQAGRSTPENLEPNSRPLKRSRNGSDIPEEDRISPLDSVASQQPRTNEARHFMQNELTHNGRLAAYQRSVLETAITFVDQLSHASTSTIEETAWNIKVPTDLSQSELVQIIMANQRKEYDSSDMQLHTLDHIPPKALERMAVGLLEGTASVQTLNMFKVIVHFKAALSLYTSQLQAPKSQAVRDHIKEMQLHHMSAALTALDAVSFMTSPSLLLLQALLTGAILLHIVGNSTSCWSITAYASRTLIALGYHTIEDPIAKTDEEEEIHAAVAWCYHFDRTMSLLLLRPASLPHLRVPPSALVNHNPANPMAIFATVLLEMAPVHEAILELSLNNHSRNPASTPSPTEEVERVRLEMSTIYAKIDKARSASLSSTSADYILHWECLEFKYFSTLTAVHRLSPTVASDPLEREKCLQCARKALEYVKQIQQLGKQQGHFSEEYNPYLSCTILSYPLCPFFVIFCNVVGTSDYRDFRLLQDVVDSASSLAVDNTYVERLYKLCNTLLALCKPLVEQTTAPGNPTSGSGPETSSTDPTGVDGLLQGTGEETFHTTGITQATDGDPVLSWDNEMMSQLFSCQPSLDWFNSDILDPTTWDLNLPSWS